MPVCGGFAESAHAGGGIGRLRAVIAHNRGLVFPVLIVTAVLILVAPLPPMVMDLLLACNVTVAVVILLTTIYVARPLEFSVFPAILLGTTLVRLVLNVASTRLILTGAKEYGTRAAGGVIEAFGQFVSGDNIVVGLIIFIILIVIQFVVITKGATRISEATARFALDGMPGKQMAIDADMNAGLITQDEAKRRREEITEQADFYGAMDGASKFVRGDAVAGIIITLINIIGGLYVGMVEHAMPFGEGVKVFTTLTIGDGLVSQVPVFLISLAAGLIVTRTSADSDLPREVLGQLFGHPEAMLLSTGGPIQLEPGARKVVSLIGATGVGKSKTIAKLAANFRLRNQVKMGLVTVDTYRIAAVEPLRTYAEIIDLPMKVVTNPLEMRRALDELVGLDLVLIDTAGHSPRDELQIQELKRLLMEARVDEAPLVLSRTSSLRSQLASAEKFASANATSIDFDQTRRSRRLGKPARAGPGSAFTH